MSLLDLDYNDYKRKLLFYKIIKLIGTFDDLFMIGELFIENKSQLLKCKLLHKSQDEIELIISFYDSTRVINKQHFVRIHPNKREAELIKVLKNPLLIGEKYY